MLTGDKGKTAKMIGLQCGMFSSESISGTSPYEDHVRTVDVTGRNNMTPEKSEEISRVSVLDDKREERHCNTTTKI